MTERGLGHDVAPLGVNGTESHRLNSRLLALRARIGDGVWGCERTDICSVVFRGVLNRGSATGVDQSDGIPETDLVVNGEGDVSICDANNRNGWRDYAISDGIGDLHVEVGCPRLGGCVQYLIVGEGDLVPGN